MARTIYLSGTLQELARSDLQLNTNETYVIPFKSMGVSTSMAALPAAADGTSLGLVAGTHGSASPILKGSDAGGLTRTEKARFQFALPPEYEDGGTVTLRAHVRMQVVSADTATLDVEAYESDSEAGIGSDLCTTAAVDINSATWANKDFTIDASGLVAGDVLDIELTSSVYDSGDSAPNINSQIGLVAIRLDIRG